MEIRIDSRAAMTRLLDPLDIGSAGAFLALADGELDQITLLKLIEVARLHFRVVEEQVARIARDETKTLVTDNLFDLSLWHC
jgi:hypothetical protein